MLTTNLIKKDILKGSEFEAGLALGGLSCFMTPDLALDLTDDIISLMSSTRPYVRTSFDFKFDIYRTENFRTDERKRAVLVTYKLFLHYPEALRLALPRLRDKLTDKGRLKTIWKFLKFFFWKKFVFNRKIGAWSSSSCCKCYLRVGAKKSAELFATFARTFEVDEPKFKQLGLDQNYQIVWLFDSVWTTTWQKARRTSQKFDQFDLCNVASIRMHQYLDSGQIVPGKFSMRILLAIFPRFFKKLQKGTWRDKQCYDSAVCWQVAHFDWRLGPKFEVSRSTFNDQYSW